MIAVQSLWQADTGKPQNPDKWRASNAALRRHYPRTAFFGNGAGMRWAREAGLSYDEWHDLPEYDPALLRAWSIGKLHAASRMTGPFIHVDGDVIVHRRLDVEDAPFFVQAREYYLYAPDWWRRLGVAPIGLPTPIPWSYNFGIFGGSAWEAIGASCREAHDFAVANKFAIAIACQHINPAVVIEQIWVPALLAREGIRPVELLRPHHWKEDMATAGFEHWLPR